MRRWPLIAVLAVAVVCTCGCASASYASYNVTFYSDTASGNASIAGTLLVPQGPSGPFPAIVLVAGSGNEDRNADYTSENWMWTAAPPPSSTSDLCTTVQLAVKPLQDVAEALVEQGWAVLRYDKRGCQPVAYMPSNVCNYCSCENVMCPLPHCIKYPMITIGDFVHDAVAAVDYLASRSDVISSRISVLGHSQGASIAPHVGALSPHVHKVGMMMADGLPIDMTVVVQLAHGNMAQLYKGMAACAGVGRHDLVQAFNASLVTYYDQLAAWVDAIPSLHNHTYGPGDVVLGLPARFWYSNYEWLSPEPLANAVNAFVQRSAAAVPLLAFNSPQDLLVTPNLYANVHTMLSFVKGTHVLSIPNLAHFMVPSDWSSPQVSPLVTDVLIEWLKEE